MSFLNSMLSMAASLGGDQKKQDQASLLTALLQVTNQHPGGLPALFEQFKQGGLETVLKSWMNQQAEPMAVQPKQLEHAMGASLINDLAVKSGLNQQLVVQYLVQLLPLLINTLAKKGIISETNIPEKLDTNSLITTVLGLLTKK
ncbi:YidB family protein [Paenalcaligenes hominis]|uniref:YidB family protein n=1 Tax=Paenalcaligenes hominis TaxID=643674 RepID=UPI0035245858